jgi:hypothetical protein
MEDRSFDNEVLSVLSGAYDEWTYVIRNILVMNRKHHNGLRTSRVLRACRRLQGQGLIREARSISLVHKNWQITEAGRAALAEKEG